MKYDITKHAAPKMPKLGKGTECIKILLFWASKKLKSMHEHLVLMFLPIFFAHVSGSENQHSDLIWKVLCGKMKSQSTKNAHEEHEKCISIVRHIAPNCHAIGQ